LAWGLGCCLLPGRAIERGEILGEALLGGAISFLSSYPASAKPRSIQPDALSNERNRMRQAPPRNAGEGWRW